MISISLELMPIQECKRQYFPMFHFQEFIENLYFIRKHDLFPPLHKQSFLEYTYVRKKHFEAL